MKLRLLPSGREEYVQSGRTFLAALRRANAPVTSGCGGRGRCGLCRVQFLVQAPEPSPADREHITSSDLATGWRLACAHTVERETTVLVPELAAGAQDKVRSAAGEVQALFPAARQAAVTLPPPAADRAHVSRLEEALGRKVLARPWSLSPLSAAETGAPFTMTTVGRKLVALVPGGVPGGPYGVALDVGTTTVAAYVLDLGSGREVGARAAHNRQGSYGADVVSRVSYAQQEGESGLRELQRAIRETINHLLEELLEETGLEPRDLVHAAVVGNPAMLHLVLGADPACLGQAPFAPLWRRWLTVDAGVLGLELNPGAPVDFLPVVSGYVGADVVAGAVSCDIHNASEPVVFLDLGTNGEIVLAAAGRMVACSAAAGPAFEAVGIACGMSALAGAVSRVEIDDDVRCGTIGSAPPKGLCGTGLTDAVAELLKVGIVDSKGKMAGCGGSAAVAERITGEGKARRFLLARGERPVYLAQSDVRKLQLAKAALRSGLDVLLSQAGLEAAEVERVYLAGAFGAHMRVESLVRIGLLPQCFREKVEQTGNAAGAGAKDVLCDRRLARDARRVARRMEFVELASEKEFGRRYVERMWFPEQTREVQL